MVILYDDGDHVLTCPPPNCDSPVKVVRRCHLQLDGRFGRRLFSQVGHWRFSGGLNSVLLQPRSLADIRAGAVAPRGATIRAEVHPMKTASCG